MRVLMLLTKAFRHDPRVYHEAQALRGAGHEVTVLEWARHVPDAPAEEDVDGVRVVRTLGTARMQRMQSDLLRNPLWWKHAAHMAQTLHEARPIDVVHCHDLDTLRAGVVFKQRTGAKLVFDAHEDFALMIRHTTPWPVPQVARLLERLWTRHVDLLVTVSTEFAEAYKKRVDCPVAVVWNAFGDRPSTEPSAPLEGDFTVVYIGTLSSDRMFPQLVDALGDQPGVRFVVGGKKEGVYSAVEHSAARYRNVAFLGTVPFDEVLPWTRQAHAVISMLDPRNPQYRIAVPTKLFDAMSTGRPLVATAGTAAGRFVEEHQVGVACAYDVAAVRAAVHSLAADPARAARLGANGLLLARDRFHWGRQRQSLEAAYALLSHGP